MENIVATLSVEDVKLLLNPPKEKTLKDFTLREITTELVRRSGREFKVHENARVSPIMGRGMPIGYAIANGELREGDVSVEFTVIVTEK